MRVSDKAIVLQAIRHGDKKFILKLYTLHNGLATVIAAVGKSPSSKIRSSSVLPLNLLDVQMVLKQNKEIHQLTEASCYHVHNNLSASLSKLSIAHFLNEILIKTLKEHNANPHLFEFVETCLKLLDDLQEEYVNLHLYFLSELTKYLGFEPQNNFEPQTPFFDCREGRFCAQELAFPLGLSREDSALFSGFLKINALRSRISNSQRQQLLDILLVYYRLHVPGFHEVKSLDVLREVISG